MLGAAFGRISGSSYFLFNSCGILLIGALVSNRHLNGETLDAMLSSLRLEVMLSLITDSLLRSNEEAEDILFSEPRRSRLLLGIELRLDILEMLKLSTKGIATQTLYLWSRLTFNSLF